jgi:competence protein ComEC
MVVDPLPSPFGERLVVSTIGEGAQAWPPSGLRLVVTAASMPARLDAGDVIRISGDLRDRPGWLRGDPYRAMVVNATVTRVAGPSGPLFGAGNGLRRLVLDRLESQRDRPESALLAGFLVGDTTDLPETDFENLRRSGLTHFVAVSGSNVALFLGAWWLVAGPIGLGPRVRAVGGLAALVVFVVATRWEPSVVRAAAMAGLVLTGRIVGLPIGPWRALGGAVVALLLISGELATDVGFQLSVAATAGVLAGAHVAGPRAGGWARTILVATVGAQVAVLPILLARFGSVPLLSPIANLVAAPLVMAATAVGGVGLLGNLPPVLEAGLAAARGVLLIAEHAASWPQLGVLGAAAVACAGAALRRPLLRPAVAAGVAAAIVVASLPAGRPSVPAITFLDVGQGDAILIRDPGGAAALVDGGHDPVVLRTALRRNGVGRVDLLVITHGDADHVGGLDGLVDEIEVDALWYPARQDMGELLPEVMGHAAASGSVVRAVTAGDRWRLGTIDLQVLGPQRRYASDNDGSVVLWVAVGSESALLTGDVEAVGQSELPPVRPDILQVPHHGSATSNLEWLAATVGTVAVVSVGPNSYGHPNDAVIATLEAAGASVYSTRESGDVTVALCGLCPAQP